MTETKVWTTEAVAETAEEAKRKAHGSTRGWEPESDNLVLKAAADTGSPSNTTQGDGGGPGGGDADFNETADRGSRGLPANGLPHGNHHLTEPERGTSKEYSEVKDDGAKPPPSLPMSETNCV
jgi:hypothetical protein